MSLQQGLLLFLVMLPMAAMPSASVALVVVRSLSAGRASGAMAALGIVAGDLVFVTMALLGMSVLAERLGAMFVLIKFCAGAYLIWLGYGLLRSRSALELQRPPPAQRPSLLADFAGGLLLTLADIKAVLFYASLLPALVTLDQLQGEGIAAIVAVTIVAVGGVKLAYVLLAQRLSARFERARAWSAPRKLAGVAMIGCGSAVILKA